MDTEEGREGDPRASWSKLIENIVEQVSFVSSHFSYTEEYVLDHSPDWINRKYIQAAKERWKQSQTRIQEGVQSLIVMMDMAFNKGKNINQILPGSFEDAMQMQKQAHTAAKAYIKGSWWKSE